ncbi:hypothetical protein BDF22DRAFT_312376 [Syncephalis plumigaleata]|nr:hypothetical protein BDF22DRAFT_312376 [Syncephalis plumigaleata]
MEEETAVDEDENQASVHYNGIMTLWSNTSDRLWQRNEYRLPSSMREFALMAASTNGKIVALLDGEAMSVPCILHICRTHEDSITPTSSIQLSQAFFPHLIQYVTPEQSLTSSIPCQTENTQWKSAVLDEAYSTIPNYTVEDSHLILVGILAGMRVYGVIARYSGSAILPQFHSEVRFGAWVSAVCYNPRWPDIIAAGHNLQNHNTSIWCSRTGELLASAPVGSMHVWGLEMTEALPTSLNASAATPRIVSISEDAAGCTNVTVWIWPDASLLANDTTGRNGKTTMEVLSIYLLISILCHG